MFFSFRLFSCFVPTLLWVVHTRSEWIAFWTLPTALLFSWLTFGALLVGFFWWRQSQNIFVFLLSVVNLFFYFGDFRVRYTENEGIPILTWNIEGKALVDSPQQQCTLEHLGQWNETHPDGILVLQEVRSFQKKIFEKELKRVCSWAPYHKKQDEKWHQNGLMICVAHEYWKIQRPHHRDYEKSSSYGFLQMELVDLATSQTYNIMNVHLESLYTTSRSMKDFHVRKSFSHTIWSMLKQGDFEPGFVLLGKNSQAQQKQLDEIKNVLVQLKDPTLIAGDFNSPPEQWHHRNLRVEYQDAHRETGWGFGTTVARLGLLFSRVDYLYASKELYWSGDTRVQKGVTCSDHLPVESRFSIR